MPIYNPKGHRRCTSMNTAKTVADFTNGALTGKPDGAVRMTMQVLVANAIWTDDGTTPSATNGQYLYAGAPPEPYEGDLDTWKVIDAAGGTTADCRLAFYGERSAMR